MEAFECSGLWWDAQNPDDEWPGTLRFDERNGAHLACTVPKSSVFPAHRSYHRILGTAGNGEPITLIDCFDTSTQGSFFIPYHDRKIRANRVIRGLHCEEADPLFVTVSIQFANANEWVGRGGFTHTDDFAAGSRAISHQQRPDLVVFDDGTTRCKIRHFLAASLSRHDVELRERNLVEIESVAPRPLSFFQRFAKSCGALMSISHHGHCATEHFSLLPPKIEEVQRRVGSFHAVPVYKTGDQSSDGRNMLFSLSDFESRASDVFTAWFSKSEKTEDAVALYLSGVYGGGFMEQRLVALVQGAEAYHRRFMPDRYMAKDVFAEQVLAPLVAAIPSFVNKDHRAAIKARLTFAAEYSQRRRLRDLFRIHESVLKLLVKKPMCFVDVIIDLRNQFTHFPLPTSDDNPSVRANAERRLLHNWIMRLLLESCFLSEMGFTQEEIEAFVGRSDTYRQLRERFAGF